MSIDRSTHINAPVIGSAVSVGSSNVTQTVQINAELDSIIDQVIEKAETDDAISKKEYATITKEIENFRLELQQPKTQEGRC